MCCECKGTIFSHRDFIESIRHRPPDQRAYETLRQFERGIQLLLPSFHRTLQALQPPDGDAADKPPPTHAQIQEAAKIRKRLVDAFAKYDLAAKRIRDMKTDSPTQQRLQKAIYASASSFLHANLIPLKSVPAMLRSHGSSNHRRLLSSGGNHHPHSQSHASPLRNGESATTTPTISRTGSSGFDAETSSLGGASEVSTAVSAALETEEREARERLVVLEEQRFMVHEMLANARSARRFEEVSVLSRNVEELDREIEEAKRLVEGVEERWEGLFAGAGTPGA
jgi:hypothetical protein